MPVFAASTPMSSKTASSWARTNSGGSVWTSVTATVLCAVSATSADIPWQPSRANAFRSAWMPAPPPESDVAIVRQRGITWRSPQVRLASDSMATVAASWDELLNGEELAYVTEVPAREPEIVPLSADLHPRVRNALEAAGLTGLYRHQLEAYEAAGRGKNVVISTGTASGKTLAFNLPVLDALAAEPKLRALYLYPT